MNIEPETLGDCIRNARVRASKSLRSFAKDLGIAPSYLSDIENDRRIPAETVISQISRTLGLELDDLMGLAGRVGERAERYIRRQPMAVQLFRRIAEENLDQDGLRRLLEHIDEISKEE